MIGQAHVGNHLGLQQADCVARDRVSKTGVEFLGYGCSAHDIAALDDAHFHARTGEVEGADKAVMAAADDHGIIFLGHLWLQPGAGRFSRRASGIRSRMRAQKLLRQTSLLDSGPIEKVRLAMPSCTRVISAVSSALT